MMLLSQVKRPIIVEENKLRDDIFDKEEHDICSSFFMDERKIIMFKFFYNIGA